jgi:hypothetical protein
MMVCRMADQETKLCHRTDIVTVDKCALRQRGLELMEQLM